jgi:hypothetical protein
MCVWRYLRIHRTGVKAHNKQKQPRYSGLSLGRALEVISQSGEIGTNTGLLLLLFGSVNDHGFLALASNSLLRLA